MSQKEKLDMDYNSQRVELIIPEYGRHVQSMIFYAKTIEDDAKRQHFVEQVVQLMLQMQPQNRNPEDLREKLWKHVFRIADYDLKVVPPTGVMPTREEAEKKPEKVDYPEIEARYRHYGHNVQKLIRKALEMEPGHKRDAFVGVIASYMKLAYKTWNKEHYVSDDVIKTDLDIISNGQLTLRENTAIDQLGGPSSGGGINDGGRRTKYQQNNRGGDNRGGNQNRGGGGNYRNRQQRNKRK